MSYQPFINLDSELLKVKKNDDKIIIKRIPFKVEEISFIEELYSRLKHLDLISKEDEKKFDSLLSKLRFITPLDMCRAMFFEDPSSLSLELIVKSGKLKKGVCVDAKTTLKS